MRKTIVILLALCGSFFSCEFKESKAVNFEHQERFETLNKSFFEIDYDSVEITNKFGGRLKNKYNIVKKCVENSKRTMLKFAPQYYLKFYKSGKVIDSIGFAKPHGICYNGINYKIDCQFDIPK